jgi:hypothetical protein
LPVIEGCRKKRTANKTEKRERRRSRRPISNEQLAMKDFRRTMLAKDDISSQTFGIASAA